MKVSYNTWLMPQGWSRCTLGRFYLKSWPIRSAIQVYSTHDYNKQFHVFLCQLQVGSGAVGSCMDVIRPEDGLPYSGLYWCCGSHHWHGKLRTGKKTWMCMYHLGVWEASLAIPCNNRPSTSSQDIYPIISWICPEISTYECELLSCNYWLSQESVKLHTLKIMSRTCRRTMITVGHSVHGVGFTSLRSGLAGIVDSYSGAEWNITLHGGDIFCSERSAMIL